MPKNAYSQDLNTQRTNLVNESSSCVKLVCASGHRASELLAQEQLRTHLWGPPGAGVFAGGNAGCGPAAGFSPVSTTGGTTACAGAGVVSPENLQNQFSQLLLVYHFQTLNIKEPH